MFRISATHTTRILTKCFAVISFVLLVRCSIASGDTFTDQQIEFFEKHVRPVLVEHCYECHSGSAKKLRAGLRLDSRQAMLTGGDSGPAIEPGKSDESLLVEAINYESFEMPPRGKLGNEVIRNLEKWIDDGAAWPDEPETESVASEAAVFDWQARKAAHWSWQPIQNHSPPESPLNDWANSDVDHFIAAKLSATGLSPAAAADRRTILRRVYFDLIGLPPSLQAITDFLGAEDEEAAYVEVVDQLLASPHFGEKWGRHWLDLVRYAESYGHEFDYDIAHVHEYRNYVIRALNADVPYDQFVREHLAGDLLETPRLHPEWKTNESIVATGMWFLGEATHGPTSAVNDEAKRVENQVDVMSKAMLGLSVSCAMCHDHKFDPISTEDYYALTGVMKSMRLHVASLLPLDDLHSALGDVREADRDGQVAMDEAIKSAELSSDDVAKHILEFDPETEFPEGHPMAVWQVFQSATAAQDDEQQRLEADQDGEAKEPKQADDVAQAMSRLNDLEVRRRRFLDGTRPVTTIESEGFASSKLSDWFFSDTGFHQISPSTWRGEADGIGFCGIDGIAINRLVHGAVGTARTPTFQLGNGHVFIRLRGKNAKVRMIVHNYQLEPFNALLFEGTRKLDDQLGDGSQFSWIHMGNPLRKEQLAYLEFTVASNGFLFIDEVRIDDGPGDEPADQPNDLTQKAFRSSSWDSNRIAGGYGAYWEYCRKNWGTPKQTPAQVQFVDWLVQRKLIEIPDAAMKQRDAARKRWNELPEPRIIRAVAEGTPMDGRVAIRGNAMNLGHEVPRRLPLAISGETQSRIESGSGRLELADRLLAESNPFPARVAVNRIWHHLFGRGIVESVDDFGAMGQLPSHPSLMDWLASEFRRDGWSQKRMIRRLVLSSTYRMSSAAADQEAATRLDPGNRLLHRASIRRLPAEAIRDQLLTISGSLDPTVGGKSVPVFVTPYMNGRGKPESGPRDGAGRRSIYLSIRRNFLPSELMAFDFPVPTTTIGRRTQSNVPAQSLAMMNDKFVHDQAIAWADRICASEPDPAQRVRTMFESAIGRLPSDRQVEDCLDFVQSQAALHGVEDNDENEKVWADLCHVIFNLKEMIFIR